MWQLFELKKNRKATCICVCACLPVSGLKVTQTSEGSVTSALHKFLEILIAHV